MIHNQTHVCASQQLMSKTDQPWSGHKGAGKTLVTMGTSEISAMSCKSGQKQWHILKVSCMHCRDNYSYAQQD